ncbi:hypothetical protein IKU74_05455 [bacterium]|nr:hypothetical protein [bacterium]
MKPLNNVAEFMSKQFMNVKNYLYKNYGEAPGKMLVHTGVLGWILSSAAQVTAVMFNDKISAKEKLFLIPQECADAGVNIISFYLVTNTLKNIGSKLVSTGKLVTPKIKQYIKQNNLTEEIGKITTDIKKGMTGDIREHYTDFKNGVDVITSTTGAILSCNIITPVLRNQYAANKQKEVLAKKNANIKSPSLEYTSFHKPLRMTDYQLNAYSKYSSNMKI